MHIYELKYRIRWSGTIYSIINYRERTLREITTCKKAETAKQEHLFAQIRSEM